MSFGAPAWLALLTLPVLVTAVMSRFSRPAGPVVSSLLFTAELPVTWRVRLRRLPVLFRYIALALLALALASPACRRSTDAPRIGMDVVLLIDVSQSMRARDVEPDRLGKSLIFAQSVVRKRPQDRVGVLLFAGDNLLACPLTGDHRAVMTRLSSIEPASGTGTALGSAILGALKRFPAAHRAGAVVAITDGTSDATLPDPVEAARIAMTVGIPIMTIGVGRNGPAPFPTEVGVVDAAVELDEATLRAVAAQSGGAFFDVESPTASDDLDHALDAIEARAGATAEPQPHELGPWLVSLAVAVLLFEMAFVVLGLRSFA